MSAVYYSNHYVPGGGAALPRTGKIFTPAHYMSTVKRALVNVDGIVATAAENDHIRLFDISKQAIQAESPWFDHFNSNANWVGEYALFEKGADEDGDFICPLYVLGVASIGPLQFLNGLIGTGWAYKSFTLSLYEIAVELASYGGSPSGLFSVGFRLTHATPGATTDGAIRFSMLYAELD